MARATITLTGMDTVLRNLSTFGKRTQDAAASALYEEANAIKNESQARYVPVDTGELRQEHAFIDEQASIVGGKVSIELGYSGPYAAKVHENPRAGKTGGVSPSGKKYSHWATTGEWKFLERPILEAVPGMASRLAERIRRKVGGG